MWNETRHSVEQEQKSKVQTGWRRYTRVINPCFLGCLQRASLGRALQVPSAGKETTCSKAMRMLQLHISSGKLLPGKIHHAIFMGKSTISTGPFSSIFQFANCSPAFLNQKLRLIYVLIYLFTCCIQDSFLRIGLKRFSHCCRLCSHSHGSQPW